MKKLLQNLLHKKEACSSQYTFVFKNTYFLKAIFFLAIYYIVISCEPIGQCKDITKRYFIDKIEDMTHHFQDNWTNFYGKHLQGGH